jgi:hypothetical protein
MDPMAIRDQFRQQHSFMRLPWGHLRLVALSERAGHCTTRQRKPLRGRERAGVRIDSFPSSEASSHSWGHRNGAIARLSSVRNSE